MPKEINEWTVMFYCAGDNALAPVIVSQLKDIKDAGFQENTDVLIQFDPNERGAPTRIYDVNRKRKNDPRLPNTLIGDDKFGDGRARFVRDLKDDTVSLNTILAEPGGAELVQRPDTIPATRALEFFLNFCLRNHPAKHYILILLGHGIVVGNDAFLPDENPVSSVRLTDLEVILRRFADQARGDGGAFELLALHSCSMSAVEVAYQMQGTANYMMGSEGISYVGSWSYRRLLKLVFNTVEEAKSRARMNAEAGGQNPDDAAKNPQFDVRALVEQFYQESLESAVDYVLSGLSLDLCLCSLSEERFTELSKDMRELTVRLKDALRSPRGKELILLAHWEAQSYWGETFTDLFDFCLCLRRRCGDGLPELAAACDAVMARLAVRTGEDERSRSLVLNSDHFGPKYQYSHGLSVYFPWSKPVESVVPRAAGEETDILKIYRGYRFTEDLGYGASWLSFLEAYFEETRRTSRIEEDGAAETRNTELFASLSRKAFHPFGPLAHGGAAFASLSGPGKSSPSTGFDCSCGSIKNYPEEAEPVHGRRNFESFSVSAGIFRALRQE